MPQAVIAVAAWVGTTTATVLGGSAIATSIGAAAANLVVGLGFANGIMAGIGAWGTVLSIGSAVMSLTQKVPKPPSTAIQLDNKRDPNGPIPIVYGRAPCGGYLIYEATGDTKKAGDNIRLSRVLALSAGGPIEGIESFSAGGYKCNFNADPTGGLAYVTSTDAPAADSKLFLNNFRMRYRLGYVPETVDWATATGTAMRDVGPTDFVSGMAVAIQHLDNLPENFPGGLPSDMRWVLKGKKCYDPRKDSSYPGGSGSHRLHVNSTYEWTENPYIIALDYLFGHYENGVKLFGIGASTAEIDIGAFVAGANICDDADHNWKLGGELSSQDDPYQVLTTILQAGGGVPVNRGAQFSCVVKAPKTSIYTIGIDDVVGDANIDATPSWRDRPNRVVPLWRNEFENWEMVGGEAIEAPLYVDQDGGEEHTVEVQYPLVQQATQAHQLATYDLMEAREFLQFTITCRPRLLTVRVGDCVTVNLPEIASNSVKCLVISRTFDPETYQVTLTLKSETDAKHAFALGQSQVAPVMQSLSGTYDGSNPNAPGTGEFADWFIVDNKIVSNGVTLPAIVVAGMCDDPNIAILNLEIKEFGETDWTLAGTADMRATRFVVTNVKPLTNYEVAMKYVSVLGVPTVRISLGSITTADLKIPTKNIWDEIANAALSDFFGEVANNAAAVANALAEVETIIDDVNLLGETQLEASLRDIEMREDFEALTYINGQTVVNAVTFVSSEVHQLSDGQDALAEELHLLGAKNANATAFILDLDTAKVSNTESLAQRFTAISTSFDTANALIIETANAFATANAATAAQINLVKADLANTTAAVQSEAQARVTADTAIADELHLLGAKNANSTAFVLDQSKVYIDNSTSLANRLTSMSASSNAYTNAQIVTVQTAQAANNAAFASSISSVSATANGASSSASTALSASSTNGSRWGVTLNTNGHITGLLLNNGGANKSTATFVVDNFVVASTSGGVTQTPFIISGSTVKMTNVEVDTIKANIITTNHLVGAAVSALDSADNGSPATLNSSETTFQTFSFTSTGGAHLVDVYGEIGTTGSGAAGAVMKVYCDGSLIQIGSIYCPGSWGGVGLSMPAKHTPGAGTHSYAVTFTKTSGSGSANVNRSSIRVTELKR